MEWIDAFQYFLEGKIGDKGKGIPKGKTNGSRCKPLTWEQAEPLPVFGAILNEDMISVGFDNTEQYQSFLKMREANGWKCLIFENPLNGHANVIFKNSQNRVKTKSGADKTTACGLCADFHAGYTYFRLREDTHERFPPSFEPDTIDEIPDELLPVETKKKLWKLSEGQGRNSELYSYIPVLQTQLHLSNDRCRKVITNINDFVFDEPLPEEEIDVILREESFAKYEVLPLTSISASDLLSMEIEPVYFAVKDVLPMGLSIIASPPKFGKSYLCTQLSLAVANGDAFLGFDTNRSGVLYMALEDSFNRCKERLLQELQGRPAPRNLDIMIDCPSIGNGLIEQLQDYVSFHPDTKLIIIDTFAKIRDGSKSNEGAYSADYREAGLVKKFADRNQVAVLLVHHTRKLKDADDPFANISGTQGLTGACDTMIVLTKDKRTDELTHFHITGRDVIQNEYGIRRNQESGMWMRHEEGIDELQAKIDSNMLRYQYEKSTFRQTILKLMETEGQWSGRCGELISASKKCGTPITETAQKLAKVMEDFNPFMIEIDHIYHSIIEKGNASKVHRFEKCS